MLVGESSFVTPRGFLCQPRGIFQWPTKCEPHKTEPWQNITAHGPRRIQAYLILVWRPILQKLLRKITASHFLPLYKPPQHPNALLSTKNATIFVSFTGSACVDSPFVNIHLSSLFICCYGKFDSPPSLDIRRAI